MDITFINVGYGESILVTSDNSDCQDGQFVMLIDGGSAMDSEYTGNSGRIRAVEFLMKKGIQHIDLLVFSHVHEDHVNGLIPIIRSIPVKQFWTSIVLAPEFYGKTVQPGFELSETNRKALSSVNAYSMLMDTIPQDRIKFLNGIHPGYLHCGDLIIDILGPEENYKRMVESSMNRIFTFKNDMDLDAAITQTTETMNNASLILRLTENKKSALLCADTNARGFGHILHSAPELLRADVFKIGHHGQADSVSREVLEAVNPSMIVCCASNDYRNKSSAPETFALIRDVMGDRQHVYLFQDGGYNAQWNPNTAPRNGVTVHFSANGISWSLA